ncbi:MAG: hypothetical protein ACK40S_02960 [Burkholderiaceae bacterium]
MSNHQRTAAWLAACGLKPGNPENLSTQIGCDIEEVVELLQCIECSMTEGQLRAMGEALGVLQNVATALKAGRLMARIAPGKEAEFLDAICDREVTGNGIAFLAGFDKDGADKAVLDSNDAKLVDGKAVFVPGTKKIAKPEGWVAPDLTPFVAKEQ